MSFVVGDAPLDLAALRRVYREAPHAALAPEAERRMAASAAAVARLLASGRPAYGINTGFGRLSQDRQPRAGRLRRAAGAGGAAGVALQPRHPAVHPVQGLGRRLRRPRPARPPLAGPARHRGRARRRPRASRRGRARRSGPRADPPRAQGGPCAAQRHAGVDGARPARAVRGGGPVRGRSGGRRDVGGRGGRQRHALRRSHPRPARPLRAARNRRVLPRAARRQRDPPLAPGRRSARAGSVQPALPAAGDGRLPRADALRGRRAGRRGQRRDRQPAGVRRHRRGGFRRQLPRGAGGPGRRRAGRRHRRDRRALGAAHRAAHRRLAVRPATVPGRAWRRELGVHDRAGHGGGARKREQVAGASGQRGQPAHVRQPGRPRQHGHVRRPPPGGHGRQRRAFYDHDRYFAPDIAALQARVEAGVFRAFVPGLLPSDAEAA